MKDILRKLLCADNLAIVVESQQDMQEALEEWKEAWTEGGPGEDGCIVGQTTEREIEHHWR